MPTSNATKYSFITSAKEVMLHQAFVCFFLLSVCVSVNHFTQKTVAAPAQ